MAENLRIFRFFFLIIMEYSEIYDFNNLLKSFKKASSCKRYKNSVMRFYEKLEENLIEIQNELIWKTYEVGDFNVFKVYEPKERIISSLPFKDRVVQIALCNIIEPEFEKSFIFDSFACRVGKGTLHAANRLSYFINKNQNYYLKCDIAKYFYSVNIEILEKLIEKKIKDKDILWLISKILRKDNPEKGIKIGNRLSQLCANIYLHELDFFVKQKLGVKFYIRYMDDFIILANSKSQLWDYLKKIQIFLSKELELSLNGKTTVGKCKNGIDFVGYKIFPNRKMIKKRAFSKFKKLIKVYKNNKISKEKFLRSYSSMCGHAKGSSSLWFYLKNSLKIL